MKDLLHRLSNSMIISGILNLLFGAFALVWSRLTLLTLVWIFAIVMIIQGIYQLTTTVGWLPIIGLISILSGSFVLLKPGDGALDLLWLIAAYAIVFGIGLLILGFKAKKWITIDDIAMWAE